MSRRKSGSTRNTKKPVLGTKREQWKYSVQKVKPETVGKFDIAVAGGGDGELIDAFIDQFKDGLANFSGTTLKKFKQFMQSEILRFMRQEKTWTAGRHMRLIVAARSQEQQAFEFWRSAGSKLVRIDTFRLVGFTDYLYQHAASQMYSPTIPLSQAVLAIAIYTAKLTLPAVQLTCFFATEENSLSIPTSTTEDS